MSETHQFDNWKISLATRNNLLSNDIPYIPVLVENISMFLSFEDYEDNGIKTIQTIGEVVRRSEACVTLLSMTPGNNSEFPLSLKNLNVNDIYVKDSSDNYCAIWEKYVVFKVYGTLKAKDLGHVLELSHFVPVQDLMGTWHTMMLLVEVARSERRQYYRTKAQNNMLHFQWDKMKEEKKRLVLEKEA